MLTVKVIHPDGIQEIFPVVEVKATPRISTTAALQGMDVYFERGGTKGLCQVSAGSVFVMNDSGKTVARYDLGNAADEKAPMGAIARNASAGIGTFASNSIT